MTKTIQFTAILLLTSLILITHRNTFATPPDEYKTIPAETIKDKIRGGLLGQMLGNLNGIPHEFAYNDEPGNIKNYVPSLSNGARTDDYTDFDWVYIYEMQQNLSNAYPEKWQQARHGFNGYWKVMDNFFSEIFLI